jgi:exoribonuclease R
MLDVECPMPLSPRSTLQAIAHRVMIARGLAPDFTSAAWSELKAITAAAVATSPATRDLRQLLWCSIDNDDSRDLDQLSVAEARPNGATKILVAIADVSAVVKPGSALDAHARQNTTSVYTAAQIFPMLPEKLSTDLTSLGFAADRLAIVIEMVFAADGSLASSDIYPATVRNRAKLAYNSVAGWIEGAGPCHRRSAPCPAWPTISSPASRRRPARGLAASPRRVLARNHPNPFRV